MEKRKLILVSNDDGIDANGLASLVRIAQEFGDVYVVAPEKGQSGMSHSISLTSPLRVRYLEKSKELTRCAIPGTPVDCVKLGINQLLPRRPDLMLSGINHGSNSAVSVIYSGTMGAAIESSLYGIPSIRFSVQDHSPNADFSLVEKFGPKLIHKAIENGLPEQVSLNVNFPVIDAKDFKGFKVGKQTRGVWNEDFEKRIDPHGREYYWLTGSFLNYEPENEEADEWALAHNYASVVPIKIDFTEYKTIETLKTGIYNMEAKPNMIKKYNKPIVGLVGGLILPALAFLAYYGYIVFSANKDVSLIAYIETVYAQGAFTPILSLCVLPNLGLYFLFKKMDYWYAIKGVIVSVLAYTILVLVLKFM